MPIPNVALLVAFFAVLCFGPPELEARTGARAKQSEITIDAGRGDLTVHLPAADPNSSVPLLLALHGYGSSGEETESFLQWADEVDARGFAYAYPNGTFDPTGRRFWDATPACCDFIGLRPGDDEYLMRILAAVRSERAISHLVLFGVSNGGFMSYRMACERAGTVRAIVSLAGANFNDPSRCQPARPVRVAQFHGTNDDTILYEGGRNLQPYPAARDSTGLFARRNGCATPIARQPVADHNYDADVAGRETTQEIFVGCPEGGSVELYTMAGSDHVPNLTAGAEARMLDFLLGTGGAPPPGPGPDTSACLANEKTLCLRDGRFELRATFVGPEGLGQAKAEPLTPDTGFLYFFRRENIEIIAKVLDGCGVNQQRWVFLAGLTNLRVEVTVRDTETGAINRYSNSEGTPFQPVQDTAAFACEP